MPQGRDPLILLLRPHPVEIGPLARAGIVSAIPLLRIAPRKDSLKTLEEKLGSCDWLVLTSPRAPSILREIREQLARAAEHGLRIAVVGPKTAERLQEELGLQPSLVPSTYTGEALARELASKKPSCILVARSEKATPGLVNVLKENNINYIEVKLYGIEVVRETARIAAKIADDFDYVVFTSPSIASAFFTEYSSRPRFTPVAIGPTTAEKLRQLGASDILVPREYTLNGIAELIARHWSTRRDK